VIISFRLITEQLSSHSFVHDDFFQTSSSIHFFIFKCFLVPHPFFWSTFFYFNSINVLDNEWFHFEYILKSRYALQNDFICVIGNGIHTHSFIRFCLHSSTQSESKGENLRGTVMAFSARRKNQSLSLLFLLHPLCFSFSSFVWSHIQLERKRRVLEYDNLFSEVEQFFKSLLITCSLSRS